MLHATHICMIYVNTSNAKKSFGQYMIKSFDSNETSYNICNSVQNTNNNMSSCVDNVVLRMSLLRLFIIITTNITMAKYIKTMI